MKRTFAAIVVASGNTFGVYLPELVNKDLPLACVACMGVSGRCNSHPHRRKRREGHLNSPQYIQPFDLVQHCWPSNLRKSRTALSPPKAKEFERAYSGFDEGAGFGRMVRSHSESGSGKL